MRSTALKQELSLTHNYPYRLNLVELFAEPLCCLSQKSLFFLINREPCQDDYTTSTA